ncbi:MAG: ArsR family transcriptional regulator [Pseudomonadota bacterium]
MAKKFSESYHRLSNLMVGAKVAIALRTVTGLGIADELADGPKTATQLAEKLGLSEDPLRRVLRALTQFGVFTETTEGEFQNSELSEYLREDSDPSLRNSILFLNDDVSLQSWLRLGDTLKDGQSRFQEVNGGPLFSLFGTNKPLGDHFAKCMRELYGTEAGKIAQGFDFKSFGNVIDVGGVQGHVLAAILLKNPDLTGTLFDIKPTAELAREFLASIGLAERTDVVGGDFFENVPGGFDAYLVKSVIHDWNDQKAIEILQQCKRAMADDSRLLIVEEVVVPGQSVGNPNRLVDLDLMIHLGGKERTEEEYRALLAEGGLTVEDMVPIADSFFSVIVCSR